MIAVGSPRLSIVIPAFNEANRLPSTLTAIAAYLKNHWQLLPAEILVVNDGSLDATAACAAAFQPPEGISLVIHSLPENRGKGAAVRAGLALASGEQVLLCDADLATPIEELEKLLPYAGTVVCGSRALDRRLISRHQPWLRDRLGRVFNWVLRLLGLTKLRDTQCGFKLLPGGLAGELSKVLHFDGFVYDVELLSRAERLGFPPVEVPVRWAHVDESRVRPLADGVRMVKDALRLRWKLWGEDLKRIRKGERRGLGPPPPGGSESKRPHPPSGEPDR